MNAIKTVDEITAIDLRTAATRALAAGEVVQLHRETFAGLPVETLVIGNGRAGQVTNSTAKWGEWSAEEELIYLDELSATEEQIRVDLQGREETF